MGYPMRIILLTVLLPLLAFAQIIKRDSLPVELRGDIVPQFNVLPGYNNREHFLQLAKPNTRYIVFSFFATWCIPCAEEFKILKEKANQLDSNGVQIYLINIGEKDFEKVKEFAKNNAENAFPLYFSPNGRILELFGLPKDYFPVFVVMDSKLRVLGILRGKGEDFPEVLWKKF